MATFTLHVPFDQSRLHLSPLLLADVEAASDEVIMALMASNREWPWWPYDIWRWWWKGAVVDMAVKVELLAAKARAVFLSCMSEVQNTWSWSHS